MSSGPNSPRSPEQKRLDDLELSIFLRLLRRDRYGDAAMNSIRQYCDSNSDCTAQMLATKLQQRTDAHKLETSDADKLLKEANDFARAQLAEEQMIDTQAAAEALAEADKVGCAIGVLRRAYEWTFGLANKTARGVRSMKSQGPWETTVIPARAQERLDLLRFNMTAREREGQTVSSTALENVAIAEAQNDIKTEIAYDTLTPAKQTEQDKELAIIANVMKLYNTAVEKLEHCAQATEHAHSFRPSEWESKTALHHVGHLFHETCGAIDAFIKLVDKCSKNSGVATRMANTKSECRILLDRAEALESALKAFTSGSFGGPAIVSEAWAERAGPAWETAAQYPINAAAHSRQTEMLHLLHQMTELRERLDMLHKLTLLESDPSSSDAKKEVAAALKKHDEEMHHHEASGSINVLAYVGRGVRENLLKILVGMEVFTRTVYGVGSTTEAARFVRDIATPNFIQKPLETAVDHLVPDVVEDYVWPDWLSRGYEGGQGFGEKKKETDKAPPPHMIPSQQMRKSELPKVDL